MQFLIDASVGYATVMCGYNLLLTIGVGQSRTLRAIKPTKNQVIERNFMPAKSKMEKTADCRKCNIDATCDCGKPKADDDNVPELIQLVEMQIINLRFCGIE